MKGSIHQKGDKWFVAWYHDKRQYKIYRYKGEFIYSRKVAEKLRSLMQSDSENGTFRIEKYIGERFSDVCEYLDEWLKSIRPNVSPGTFNTYGPIVKCRLKPFFMKHQIYLHDIQYDTLMRLLSSLTDCSPVYKTTILKVMHACLSSAWKSGRIKSMPAFPEKKYFQLMDQPIEWIPTDRQMAVIDAMPPEHQPIFLFLKYHLRRPAEACALHWSDYDHESGCFIIRHNISGRQLVERTKTGISHVIPCHDAFRPVIEAMRRSQIGKFVFTHRKSQIDGKAYNVKYLEMLWGKACLQTGETISLYRGLKHSSCSQYVNELGLSLPELQAVTGHASMDAVKKYANVELARKRELMHTVRVIPMTKKNTQ